MNFTEYKNTINQVASCKPVDGWSFERMITLLDDVVLKCDEIEKHVDEGVDRLNKTFSEKL